MAVVDPSLDEVGAEAAQVWVENDRAFTHAMGDVSDRHGLDLRRPADRAELHRIAALYLREDDTRGRSCG